MAIPGQRDEFTQPGLYPFLSSVNVNALPSLPILFFA